MNNFSARIPLVRLLVPFVIGIIACYIFRISIPVEVFPALIKSGGPFFGRETLERQLVTVPLLREGHVELGELRNKGVVEDPPAPVKTKSAPEEKKR